MINGKVSILIAKEKEDSFEPEHLYLPLTTAELP
jgi:hypothetical protein